MDLAPRMLQSSTRRLMKLKKHASKLAARQEEVRIGYASLAEDHKTCKGRETVHTNTKRQRIR